MAKAANEPVQRSSETDSILDQICLEQIARLPLSKIKTPYEWEQNFSLQPPDTHMTTYLESMASQAMGLAEKQRLLIQTTPYRVVANNARVKTFFDALQAGALNLPPGLLDRKFDHQAFPQVLTSYAREMRALAKAYRSRALNLTQAEGFCKRLPFLLMHVGIGGQPDFQAVMRELGPTIIGSNGEPLKRGYDVRSFRNTWNDFNGFRYFQTSITILYVVHSWGQLPKHFGITMTPADARKNIKETFRLRSRRS